MCKEQPDCPYYKEILKGKTPLACSKCFYFNKLNKVEFYSKVGLLIGIGIFIAFPISIYLIETEHFSKQLSIMLGGLGSFGLPDFIIKHWSNVLQKLIDVFTLSKTNKDKNKY